MLRRSQVRLPEANIVPELVQKDVTNIANNNYGEDEVSPESMSFGSGYILPAEYV